MSEIHSRLELRYKPRRLASVLASASRVHPVVVLTGARQTGKTTLLRTERPFAQWLYLTLDDYETVRQAGKNPEDLWAGRGKVILDEVQKAPDLLHAVKKTVDESRRRMRFVLSGSAHLLLMAKVSESLAGRAVYFTLHPMTLSEATSQRGRAAGPRTGGVMETLLQGGMLREGPMPGPATEALHVTARGCLPPVWGLRSSGAVSQWWEGYVATYLERDLRQLSQVESLPDFRRVMEVAALRTGQVTNQTGISRDAGVSQPTVHRYLNLLEASCLLMRVPAFTKSRTKRLVKSPKLYWADPGLAAFLCGLHDPESLRRAREAGALFENLAYLHLAAACERIAPRPRVHYWRTGTGREVDFVIEHARRLLAIEVKLSTRVSYSDQWSLDELLRDYGENARGAVVYQGREIVRLGEKVWAVPWHALD